MLDRGTPYLTVDAELADDSVAHQVGVKRPTGTSARAGKFSRGSVATALAGVVGVAVLGTRQVRRSGLHANVANSITAVEDWSGVPPCGLIEHGIEYVTEEQVVGQYSGIMYDILCRDKCFNVPECQLWTWTPDQVCTLKSIQQHETPTKMVKEGAISGGMPCSMDGLRLPGTLYCWVLVMPDSYEVDLLIDQYSKHLNIFNCEGFELVSNKTIVGLPLPTTIVDTSLSCQHGGEFGTALNTDIFLAVWTAIIQKGTYQMHDWTVKTDVDAVFFAERLRGLLPHHPEEARGVYLNNCKHGMHGPIEVFSRNAVNSLGNYWQPCKDHFYQMCNGDCRWGEDLFIDQCLWKVAGARRDNEWSLLVEDHCSTYLDPGSQPEWTVEACDGTHVAFHPFKDKDTYMACFSRAWHAAVQEETQMNVEVQEGGEPTLPPSSMDPSS